MQSLVYIGCSSDSLHMGHLIFQPPLMQASCRMLLQHNPFSPVVESTSGVKVACSTSRNRWSYCLLFSYSCLRYTEGRETCQFDWAQGLNTLTLTNAFSNLPPQKSYIATSKRAPSSVRAERCDRNSPESGCRWGSTVTHISDFS